MQQPCVPICSACSEEPAPSPLDGSWATAAGWLWCGLALQTASPQWWFFLKEWRASVSRMPQASRNLLIALDLQGCNYASCVLAASIWHIPIAVQQTIEDLPFKCPKLTFRQDRWNSALLKISGWCWGPWVFIRQQSRESNLILISSREIHHIHWDNPIAPGYIIDLRKRDHLLFIIHPLLPEGNLLLPSVYLTSWLRATNHSETSPPFGSRLFDFLRAWDSHDIRPVDPKHSRSGLYLAIHFYPVACHHCMQGMHNMAQDWLHP